jgi:hypothetical protein
MDLKTSEEWYSSLPEAQRMIVDPDGWRKASQQETEFFKHVGCWFIERISEQEFRRRYANSSIKQKGAPFYPYGETVQQAMERYLEAMEKIGC